jgi:hypothetical protein
MAVVKSEMAHLNNNLTTQMKSFIETVSAQIGVLNANMESRSTNMESRMSVLNANIDSRLANFENRFYFRMF